MEENTMLGVAYKFLEEKGTATFKQIYAAVAKELKTEWKKTSPKKLLSDIEPDKKAQLYTLITISGDFIKVTESKFGLIKDFTYEEIQKLKINLDDEV